MTLSKNAFVKLILLSFVTLTFLHCEKEVVDPDDPNNSTAKGTIYLQITDAPTDNANVEGVFVTVAEIKIDGISYEGFSGKQTIDVMAYQNGNVKSLGLSELETGIYANISFVLDYETDALGNSPGCFVQTTDGQKESLESSANSTSEITVAQNFEIIENSQTDLVLDFDLRKTITAEEESNGQWNFSFVSSSELNSGVRMVREKRSGSAKGNCNDNNPLFQSDKIIVYAYAKGSFNKDTEMHGQGTSNIEFSNAITSANVNANGQYHLAFLEEGEYELVYISYEDNGSGNFQIKGQLELSANVGIDLQSVSISASSTTTINVDVIGILPL